MSQRRHIRITRDLILFVFGLAGVTYEAVVSHVDRPSLLFVFGACIGLPAFLRADEHKTPPEPDSEPARRPTPRKRAAPAKKAVPAKKAAKKVTKRGTRR